MAIATLSIDLTARLASLQAGLDKAGQLAAKQAAQIEGAFGGLKNLGAGLFGGLTVGAAVAFARNVTNGVDALNDLADATGASVEQLSALEDVALRNGHSVEAASDAIIKLNKALFEAADDPDSAPGRALKGLGLSVKELLQLDPVERLQAVGKALNSFGGENKLQYNLALFSKSTREMAPLLKDLAEAGKLNATVTAQQAAEAEKFNKQLAALQKSSLDLSRTMLGPLVTAANAVFEAFRRNRENGKGFLANAVDLETAERIVRNNAGTYSNEGRNYPQPILPALPSKPDTAAINKAERDRLKLREDAAQAIADAEEMAARDASEAWQIYDRYQIDASKERADAFKQQWQQVFDFIDQQQDEEIQRGKEYLDALGKDSKDVAEELGLVFSSAAGQAIANFESLRDVLKGVLADIAQIAIRETITKPLSALVTNALGGFSFASIFGGGRASGGPVSAGKLYQVNERGGPGELLNVGGRQYLMARQSGSVQPQGGGGPVQIVNHIDSRTDSAAVAQLVAAGVQQGLQAYARMQQAQGMA